jgi:hypothetical protein
MGRPISWFVDVYRCTLQFPSEQRFGLAATQTKSFSTAATMSRDGLTDYYER